MENDISHVTPCSVWGRDGMSRPSALGTKVRGRGLTQGDSPLWSSTKSSGAVRL